MTEAMTINKRTLGGPHSILYFTNSTLWGGVEEHICGVLQNLSRDLFRARLVCSPQNHDRFLAGCPKDIEVTPIVLDSPRHIAGATRLARLIKQEKFEIVHSHMFWSSLFASPIAFACRVPVVVETLHGSEAWRTGWKGKCNLDSFTTRFVSKYFAVSGSDARYLTSKKRVPAEKIVTIHNGIDLSRFSASRNTRQAIRNSLGFKEEDPVLIMVARFHPGKGHSVILAAMHQLLNLYPNLRLICLGEGDGETEIRSLCNEFGLTTNVRLAGYQPNVAEWLSAADINVLPSFYEGFPLTVLEAMAAGLPSVTSRVGGIPEAIEDGVSGLLVPPGSPEKFADALSYLLSHVEARERMGEAARHRASQSFGIQRQVRNMESTYLELCGAPSRDVAEIDSFPSTVTDDVSTVSVSNACSK
jgi:glycosyltransferase involved in cell wall biosynthesis